MSPFATREVAQITTLTSLVHISPLYIGDITCQLVDKDFVFECSCNVNSIVSH